MVAEMEAQAMAEASSVPAEPEAEGGLLGLSGDLLACVLRRLPPPALAACACTCTVLRDALLDDALWAVVAARRRVAAACPARRPA